MSFILIFIGADLKYAKFAQLRQYLEQFFKNAENIKKDK